MRGHNLFVIILFLLLQAKSDILTSKWLWQQNLGQTYQNGLHYHRGSLRSSILSMRKKLKSKNVNNFNLSIISVCFCSQQGDNHYHTQQVYLKDKPNENDSGLAQYQILMISGSQPERRGILGYLEKL